MTRRSGLTVMFVAFGVVALAVWMYARVSRTEPARSAVDANAGASTDAAMLDTYVRAIEKMEREVQFFGKVVDLRDAPVEGASVTMEKRCASATDPQLIGIVPIERMTDSDGRFSIDGEQAVDLCLDKIVKEGYEFSRAWSPERMFIYGPWGDRHPDPNTPVVFRLRKKGEPTFLIESERWQAQFDRDEYGTTRHYNFISKRRSDKSSSGTHAERDMNWDLSVTVTLDEESDTRTIILATSGGGIATSEEWLDTAPETGYEPTWQFSAVDDALPAAKYLYVKSRAPHLYSRFEIQYITPAPEFIRLTARVATNPYGERNLEPATGLPSGVMSRLEGDAQEASRENKLAPKRDLARLVSIENQKGEQAFLLKVSCTSQRKRWHPAGPERYFDFIIGDWVDGGSGKPWDLSMTQTRDPKTGKWTTTFGAAEGGGIVALLDPFYIAPETGYQPSWQFVAEQDALPEARYLCVKSRDPAIYTCLEITGVRPDHEEAWVGLGGFTNPYGDRNLTPPDPHLYQRVIEQLEHETRTAFLANKRPQRPDLPKLMEEAERAIAEDEAEE